jgi:26S proteasome regulatory subunit N2
MLLDDTQPDEAKSLLEEKLKKVTTERAPVAGQQLRGASGRSGGRSGRTVLDGLVDPSRSAGNSVMEQLLRGQGRSPFGLVEPQTPTSNDPGSGAAAAAGVLTAVDEDGEGDEEAVMPNEFEYYSDDEEQEE